MKKKRIQTRIQMYEKNIQMFEKNRHTNTYKNL